MANVNTDGEYLARGRLLYMTGLRAAMEAGFGRMNDLTVLQASQVRRPLLNFKPRATYAYS
jgi:hypothetical protein